MLVLARLLLFLLLWRFILLQVSLIGQFTVTTFLLGGGRLDRLCWFESRQDFFHLGLGRESWEAERRWPKDGLGEFWGLLLEDFFDEAFDFECILIESSSLEDLSALLCDRWMEEPIFFFGDCLLLRYKLLDCVSNFSYTGSSLLSPSLMILPSNVFLRLSFTSLSMAEKWL